MLSFWEGLACNEKNIPTFDNSLQKAMVTLRKIWHCDAFRIGIYFGFDDNLKQRVKQTGAFYSRTHRCWYLNYDAENYRKIRREFPDHQVITDSGNQTSTPAPGLKNSHDTASIVAMPPAGNALPLPGAAEHNPSKAGEKVGAKAEFLSITGKYWIVKDLSDEFTSKAVTFSKDVTAKRNKATPHILPPKHLQPASSGTTYLTRTVTEFRFSQALLNHNGNKIAVIHTRKCTDQIINSLDRLAGELKKKSDDSKTLKSDKFM